MSEFTYKRLGQNNIDDLDKLFSTRKKQFKIDFYKKYNTKWTGKEYIGIFAYNSSNEPVGFLGSLPMYVEYKASKHLCVQISDAVIHPDYQKKGLFVEIIKRVIDIAEKEGAEFLYVFPSPQAFSGFKKTGWKLYSHLNHYTIDTYALPIMKIAQKFGKIKLYNEYASFIQKILCSTNVTDLKNSCIDDNNGGVDRCETFLSHKDYSYNYKIKFSQNKILWKHDDGMLIGDIERNSEHTKLFNNLKILCFLLGIHKIKFFVQQDSYWDNFLKNKGLIPTQGNPLYFYDINSKIDFSKLKFISADLNTY